MEEIIARAGGGGVFETHPEGQYPARLIDIIDYGIVPLTWQGVTKEKHRICLRFWAGQYDKEGQSLWVDAFFTLSLHENSALRPFLEAWRGKKFTDDELEGFNVAKLVGVDALVQVNQTERNDRVYANIDSIMRLPKGMEPAHPIIGYVRVKDREGHVVGAAKPDHQPDAYDVDLAEPIDALPF